MIWNDDMGLCVKYIVRSTSQSVVHIVNLHVVYAILLFGIESIVEWSPLGNSNGDVARTPVAKIWVPSAFKRKYERHHTGNENMNGIIPGSMLLMTQRISKYWAMPIVSSATIGQGILIRSDGANCS